MKKFNFQYAPLLRKKEHIEQQIQQQLAEIYGKMAAVNKTLDDLEAQMVAMYRQLETPGVKQVAQLVFFDSSIRLIGEKRVALEAELAKLAQEEGLVKEKLAIAHREKRMLEILKEKKLEAYRDEVNREEALFLDEVAVTRALLQQRS